MRDYTGVSPETLPQPDARDFHARLRDMVNRIDYYLLDQSKGIARIQKGEVPDGSGDPIGGGGTLTDYWFLPGRSGGQLGFGGTGPGDNAIISSTKDPDKGFIYMGEAKTTMFDEDDGSLGINVAPDATLHVKGTGSTTTSITLTGDILDTAVTDQTNTIFGGGNDSFDNMTVIGDGLWVSFQNDVFGGGRTGKWNLSSTIANNTTHTITYWAKNAGGTPDATTTFRFALICSDTIRYQGPVINPASAWTSTFAEYTTSVVCDGTGSPSVAQVANSIEMAENASVGTGTFSAIDYAAVDVTTFPASDIFRGANTSGTVGVRIDPSLQVGIGTGTTALTEIVTIQSIAATSGTSLLKLLPDASQTENVMEVWNFALTHKDFNIGPGGLVTIGDFTATDDDVRFQIRAPSTQTDAKPIWQAIRLTGGQNYSIFSVAGSGGPVVCGSIITQGAALKKFRMLQSVGQSVNMGEITSSDGTTNIAYWDLNGVYNGPITSSSATSFLDSLFRILDNADNTKTLKFELGGLQTGVDITQAYISTAGGGDRTITWSMTGASGTAGPTFAWAGTSTARTITFPSSASFTVAGLQVASQVFTRALTITPGLGTDALTLTTDDGSGIGTTPFKITDVGLGDQLLFTVNGGLAIAGTYLFYPSGVVGSGSSGTLASAALTASRTWTHPDFSGTVPVVGAAYSVAGLQATQAIQDLVTAASIASASIWQVFCYVMCTTAQAAAAGPNVTITITWTDTNGTQTKDIATVPLTATGFGTGSLVLRANASTAIRFTATYTPTGGGTVETYALYLRAALMDA